MSASTDIAVGLAANVVYGGLLRVIRYLPRSVKNHHLWNHGVFIGAGLCWASLNVASYVWLLATLPWVFVISSSIYGGWVWSQLRQYWDTGIVGVDKAIAGGMDYDDSLRQCQSRVEFMGIGAHKLTSSSEFEAAVKRCATPAHPVRLLLSHPDNALLENAAQKEGQANRQYQDNVKESLRRIAHFKHNRGLNIEVKLYRREKKSMPMVQYFRVMFINDQLCLVSYNVFGEGSGRQQPQMHLRRDASKRDVDSFYYAFRCHFEEMWRTAIESDLKEFLAKDNNPK